MNAEQRRRGRFSSQGAATFAFVLLTAAVLFVLSVCE